jgi:pilus assembly protein CpaB
MQNDNPVNPQNKSWKLLLLAITFALLAGLGTIVYLKVLEHRLKARLTPPAEEMASVVVAAKDLVVGSVVDSTTVAVRQVPAEYVNNDVVTPKTFNAVAGAIIVKPLAHGKMLSQDYIDLNIPKDFSGTIQVGHRAVTIQVDEINSISGMVRPGNFIDLYVRLAASVLPGTESGDGNEAGGKDLVIPVLEDVQVLATDHNSVRPNEDEFKNYDPEDQRRAYDTLTLEVTPKEAALLSIAESRGVLIAALRNEKDTAGILFGGVTTEDLLHNSIDLLKSAVSKEYNRSLAGVHLNKDGQLVTRDGVVLKDKGLHLNKNGLLVTKNGIVLSGRDLIVGPDGSIRTKNGKEVYSDTLIAGKGGSIVDANGTVIGSNGYKSLKGGFLEDKDGRILTPDGHVLSGVTIAEDGTVRTADGKILTANDIVMAKDGSVHLRSTQSMGPHLDAQGQLVDKDGKVIKAADLVTVGEDGKVRAKDGTVMDGVYVDKDGSLRNKDGSLLTAADIARREGLIPSLDHLNAQGQLVDKDGKVIKAADLVTVGEDGKVRAKDGTVLDGVYVDKNGSLRNKDGSLLTAVDVARREGLIPDVNPAQGQLLAGVKAQADPKFAAAVMGIAPTAPGARLSQYEVEYIIGGSSNGAANTYKILVDESILSQANKE